MSGFNTFDSFPFLTGLFYCSFYLLFPFLYSLFRTPKGMVWVPINNQHKYCGDNRIFASLVQESRLNFFKYKHPCADEIGNMAIDYLRVSSYRAAALLGFFLPDERWALTLSFLLSLLIQYTCLYLISYDIFFDPWISLFLALAVIFWFKTIIQISMYNGHKRCWEHIKYELFNIKKSAFHDIVNDNFRYVVMSTSGIFIWLNLILALYGHVLSPLFFTIVLLVFFTIIPFVYPSTSVATLIILVLSVFFYSYSQENMIPVYRMILAGAVALVILLATGFLNKVRNIRSSNMDVLKMAHNFKERTFSVYNLYRFLTGFSFLLPIACLLIFFLINMSQYFILSICIFFLIVRIAGFFLKKQFLFDRLLNRGAIQYLFFSALIIITMLLDQLVFIHIDSRYVIIPLILLVTLIPLRGCIVMAKALYNSHSYFMPMDEWHSYRFIKKNTKPRSSVLAFYFSNLQLLPVYTHANLYVTGAEWLSDPEKELSKYLCALRALGDAGEKLLKGFESYFRKRELFKCSPLSKPDEESLKYYYLINTLLYFPYVNKIAGKTLSKEPYTEWNHDFIELVRDKLAGVEKAFNFEEVDFLLIKKQEVDLLSLPSSFKEIYSNHSYIIFSKYNVSKAA